MTITSYIAGAALFAAVTIPAAASADPRVEPAPAPSPAPTAPAANEQRRYCFQTEMTGSMISRQVCQTRAAWRREGVDVDKYVKR